MCAKESNNPAGNVIYWFMSQVKTLPTRSKVVNSIPDIFMKNTIQIIVLIAFSYNISLHDE